MRKDISLKTLDFIAEKHAYQAAFIAHLPNFILRRALKKYDLSLFLIAKQLILMGLDDEVHALRRTATLAVNKPKALLEQLYLLFETLSADPKQQKNTAALKSLKKLIHQYAREHDFDCRLFNLKKLADIAKNATDEIERQKLNNKLEQLKRQYEGRRFAYIGDKSIKPVTTPEERVSRRQQKKWIDRTSLFLSLLVGVGEALVVVVFMSAMVSFPLALFVFGVPAFFCNFYLFRGDSYKILKDIYFGRMFRKENGDPLAASEKAFIAGSLVFSMAAALAFGFLSFGSGVTAFTALAGFLGIAALANPVGIMIVAGIVAVVTTVAIFTVFSSVMTNLMRENGFAGIKQKIIDKKNQFIEFCTIENWDELSSIQKFAQVMARVCEFAFEALFFVLAVTLVVAANYFTACMLKHQSATIFHGVFGVGYKLGTKVAISIVAIGEVINSVFDSAGVLIVVDMCKSALKAVGKAIIHPIETYRQRKADWQYTRSHPMRLVATIAKVAEYLFLTKAVIFNSVGQGIGSVPGGASKVVVGLAISSGAMSSAGTQLEAVEEKTRLPEKVEGIESKAVAVVSKDNPYRLFSSAKPRVRKTEPDEDPLESHDKITISAG